ncbi:MAG: hypothetical protein ACM31D_04765 [Bacteroidota bacterium]
MPDTTADIDRERCRLRDSEAAITRLTEESEILKAVCLSEDERISAAETTVDSVRQRVEVTERLLLNAMDMVVTLRERLAVDRSDLVEARSHLDTQTRRKAERHRRLDATKADIASWQMRAEKAAHRLADVEVRHV